MIIPTARIRRIAAAAASALLWLVLSTAVAHADVTPSATTLTSSAEPGTVGQPVSFHAFVDPTDGGGTVSFASDGAPIAGCENLPFLSGGGTDWEAGCTTSSLPLGTHYITATYSGDSAYAGSSASLDETIVVATTTTVTAAHSTINQYNADSLTAVVRSSDSGGTVDFTQDGTPVPGCTGLALTAITGAYKAVCQQKWTVPGTFAIAANYSGDAAYGASSGTTTLTVNPAPVVSSISPNGGPVAGGQTVTITGSHLLYETKVSFGNVAATNVTILSDTQLTAVAPAHAAGTVNVTIASPHGTSKTSSASRYTYDPAPTLPSISPGYGVQGTIVTLTGTGFVPGAQVWFGADEASNVVRISSTELRAAAPYPAAGTVDVTVVTPGGTSSTGVDDEFTYVS